MRWLGDCRSDMIDRKGAEYNVLLEICKNTRARGCINGARRICSRTSGLYANITTNQVSFSYELVVFHGLFH